VKSYFFWAHHAFPLTDLSLFSAEPPTNSLLSQCNFVAYVQFNGKPSALWLPFPHQMPGNRGKCHQVKGTWGTAFGFNSVCWVSVCLLIQAFCSPKSHCLGKLLFLLFPTRVRGKKLHLAGMWKQSHLQEWRHPPNSTGTFHLIFHGCWKAPVTFF